MNINRKNILYMAVLSIILPGLLFSCNRENKTDVITEPNEDTTGLSYELITEGTNADTYRVSHNTSRGGTVVIPATYHDKPVTEIGIDRYSHRNCNITSIIIPESVTIISSRAFYKCVHLTSITVDANNQNYTSEGDILYDKQKITLIAYPSATGNIIIPASVTTIGQDVFRNCDNLTSVTISASVTTIGSSAFSFCKSLTSVIIPDSVTTIGSSAFSFCDNLTSVTIPNSVTSIGEYAFADCTGLTSVTIPASVTSIGNNAFAMNWDYWNTNNLATVTFAEGSRLETIGSSAFRKCSKLTSVTIPASVTTIGNGAFSGCTSLTSITVDVNNPNYTSKDGILYDRTQSTLFAYPSATGSVTIPASITTIGVGAFSDCTDLASITVNVNNPNYASQDGILYNKEKTKFVHIPYAISGDVTIPNGVTSIGSNAFANCRSLTSITIPASVTSIGFRAFLGCRSLTSITIPASVTSIDYQAFHVCSNLTRIIIPASVTFINAQAFEFWTNTQTINVPFAKADATSSGWDADWYLATYAIIKYWNGTTWE